MAKKPASGMYRTKARNLTDTQLKRAKGLKASTKRTLSVSDTSRATTGENKGYTLGPGGKRLTGTVIMENGDRAVYKNGKRVTNISKKTLAPKKKPSTGRSTSRPASSVAASKPKRLDGSMTAAQKKKFLKDKENTTTTSGARGLTRAQAVRMGVEGPRKGGPVQPGQRKLTGFSIGYSARSKRIEKILAENRRKLGR